MGVRLKNPNGGYPPGGFAFGDPHTAMRFDDEIADLNTQVKRVIEHRKANPQIYPESNTRAFDPNFIAEEIIIQVCARQPSFCEDSDHPGRPYPYVEPARPAETVSHQGKICVKCGANEWTPLRCASCGGSRIRGWKCAQCGFEP